MNTTFRQIRQEHKDLHQLLVVLHRALCERQQSVSDIVGEFARLREHLEHHFAEEEQGGGFFDDVVQLAPHQSEQIACLRQEHQARLHDLDEFVRDATTRPQAPEWWDSLERRFHEFSRLLMGHETKENALLQETYGLDLGSFD